MKCNGNSASMEPGQQSASAIDQPTAMHARVRFARVSNRPAAARTEPAGEDENATASKA
jgi:hypothetical protein